MEPYNDQSEDNIFENSIDQYAKNKVQNKFTNRARSFKDDIIGMIASMRSTSKSPCRTPKSQDSKTTPMKSADEHDLSFCFKQVTYSLRHFLDVISKNALEMLPGNGTVVLETVSLVHSLVTSHDLNCQSSIVHSTLNQVYQSVANLIKFCDDSFMSNYEGVNEDVAKDCVAQVEQAMIKLVSLVVQDNQNFLFNINDAGGSKIRSSLPEISTVNAETDNFVSGSSKVLENSFCLNKSWESISMSNPPSKPPINRHYMEYPPPLPSKKKNCNTESLERLSASSQGECSFNSLQDNYIQHNTLGGAQSLQSDTQSAQFNSHSSISSTSQHIISNSQHLINVNHQLSCKVIETNSVLRLNAISLSPPPLPEKQTIRRKRHDSHYDNVPDLSTSLHSTTEPDDTPPPLPPKKKHIMAYMEMFGHCHEANMSCLSDTHTSCTCSLFTQSYYSQGEEAFSNDLYHYQSSLSKWINDSSQNPTNDSQCEDIHVDTNPPALPPKRQNADPLKPICYVNHSFIPDSFFTDQQETNLNTLLEKYSEDPKIASNASDSLEECHFDFLQEIDVKEHLILTEDQEDIRGAHPDALLVHATHDNNEHLYQDVFLTTYRTFKTSLEIMRKLIDRYHKFHNSSELQKQRAARESFSFLVRVVDGLTLYELENNVVKYLANFIHQLLSSGHFKPAKALRIKLLEKYSCKNKETVKRELLPSLNVYTRKYTLLDFKSEHIAEQMTLLDSELFIKIEIPEVLSWIEQQNEEKSPNLTRFTEHFNKVSYWARTRILEQNEARDREKYVVKFIKIMKHLRKMNNFNSYLGLLSALDSAPIRRLEWQKHITEGLKEYCALIDSTSSFRAYRQSLADTLPPCIPYIGLVLQDLTFVHIGNPHLLPYNELPAHIQYKEVINFSKRRQQFNIVQNMKRFQSDVHNFPCHDRITEFFSSFDDFLSEEAMWQMSEAIKPRGKPKH